jgi:hypothetical protein
VCLREIDLALAPLINLELDLVLERDVVDSRRRDNYLKEISVEQ